jgi:hypothetical protein
VGEHGVTADLGELIESGHENLLPTGAQRLRVRRTGRCTVSRRGSSLRRMIGGRASREKMDSSVRLRVAGCHRDVADFCAPLETETGSVANAFVEALAVTPGA